MLRPLVVLFAAAALAGIAAPAAATPLAGQPVAQNQYFNGVFDGQQGSVVVIFSCLLPPTLPISVTPSVQGATAAGFTGTAATSIQVSVVYNGFSTGTDQLGTLSAYDTNIDVTPTHLRSFCGRPSNGTIVFTPVPASPTAQPSTVAFRLVPIGPLP
jgi:hypothetical protein